MATATLGLLVGAMGQAQANYVFLIDDRGPGPISVANTGSTLPGPVALLGDSTADFAHFTYQIENGVVNPIAAATFSASRDMVEPNTFALSDRLVVKFTLDSPTVEVWFDSQLPVVLAVGDVPVAPDIVEDGTFQFLLGYSFLNTDTGQQAAAEFLAASEVPEPTSLALLGLALASLRLTRRRKCA